MAERRPSHMCWQHLRTSNMSPSGKSEVWRQLSAILRVLIILWTLVMLLSLVMLLILVVLVVLDWLMVILLIVHEWHAIPGWLLPRSVDPFGVLGWCDYDRYSFLWKPDMAKVQSFHDGGLMRKSISSSLKY